MAHYGLPQVRKLLRKIAKENPNHIYVRPDWEPLPDGGWSRTGCSYVHHYTENGAFVRTSGSPGDYARIEPGCIIGKMLIEEMGLDPEWFSKSIDHNGYIRGITEYLAEEDITFTDRAAEFMATVQRQQDNGQTWGRAVEMASTTL